TLIEPLCEAKVAQHRFAIFIKQDVSRLKIAMQNSLTMGVSDAARNLRHYAHALARLLAEHRRRAAKAPARRIFHAEKRQALFTFADLVYRKNVRMIKARDCFSFALKEPLLLLVIYDHIAG